MAFALGASGAASFAARARLVVCFALAVTIWTILAQPIFNHFGWGYWIYSFIAESTGLILAGLVIARWFVAAPAAVARGRAGGAGGKLEQAQEAVAGLEIGAAGGERLLRLGVRAPGLDLPLLVQRRRRPGGLEIDRAFGQRQRDHAASR